jgi:hypothetical protein
MGKDPYSPYLTDLGSKMGPMGEIYQTGTIVPQTGIYRVVHTTHRLPHEAVVIKGQRFPKCQKCANAVLFELVHAAADLFRHATYFIYELPAIEEDGDSVIASAV